MTLPSNWLNPFDSIWPLSSHPCIGQGEKWDSQPRVEKKAEVPISPKHLRLKSQAIINNIIILESALGSQEKTSTLIFGKSNPDLHPKRLDRQRPMEHHIDYSMSQLPVSDKSLYVDPRYPDICAAWFLKLRCGLAEVAFSANLILGHQVISKNDLPEVWLQ